MRKFDFHANIDGRLYGWEGAVRMRYNIHNLYDVLYWVKGGKIQSTSKLKNKKDEVDNRYSTYSKCQVCLVIEE